MEIKSPKFFSQVAHHWNNRKMEGQTEVLVERKTDSLPPLVILFCLFYFNMSQENSHWPAFTGMSKHLLLEVHFLHVQICVDRNLQTDKKKAESAE